MQTAFRATIMVQKNADSISKCINGGREKALLTVDVGAC